MWMVKLCDEVSMRMFRGQNVKYNKANPADAPKARAVGLCPAINHGAITECPSGTRKKERPLGVSTFISWKIYPLQDTGGEMAGGTRTSERKKKKKPEEKAT
ncbi:hypothetical protein H206_02113 [Candidatus Electrothrix aarhusensis]|uniref:Uncharacterized protein n=1 Tax=Candidatus Electrothrix aarhusensis TaxID=1859131 RepID=A0A3S3QRE5_9BACT|nr:hypothetical protein H206_02113 [Candidatus Electrothrix aarhusensis]